MIIDSTQSGSAGNNAFYLPRDFGNLARWFNVADPGNNGVIPADGAALSLYADKSTNAANITQSTGANQPVYKKNILNGHPMILFNGTSNFFSGTVVGGTQYSVTFICKSLTTAGANQTPLYNGNSSTSGYGFLYNSQRLVVHGGVAIKTDGSNPVAFEIITFAWDGSTSVFRVNGVTTSLTNATSGYNTPTGSLLVGSSSGTLEWMNGYMGDIIMRNSYSLAAIQADEHFIASANGLSI